MAEEPRNGRFDCQGVRYRYLTWGADSRAQPPIVLVHGFAQSARSWSIVAAMLAERRPVHAFELVGHGGSQVPASAMPYTLGAQGETLLAFLDHVKPVAAKPVVVGYSMGGRVALAAAQRDPDAFGALVLESAGLGPASQVEREASAQRDAANARRLREVGVEAFMDGWERLPLFDTQRALPAEARARVRAARLANDAEALARTFEHAGQHTMPDRRETLAALDALAQAGASVLYLAGELDDKYRALASELAATSVRARIIPRAGHNVHLEAPEAFVEALYEAVL